MYVRTFSGYFTEPNWQKYAFYFVCILYVSCTTLAIVVEPFLALPCDEESKSSDIEFPNHQYQYSPCGEIRHPCLGFLTRNECVLGRHLLMAVFLGSMIGYERRTSDRPAGIRTMSLVSLGSALFTINSTYGFLSGPMGWDSSRVSAAIPSGVGFLGGGLIVKSSEVDPVTGERHHLVQGITTAAATWLSAAVGIACGGGMYFPAAFSTALNLLLLRFGPRTSQSDESSVATRMSGTEWSSLVDKDVEADAPNAESRPSYGGTDGSQEVKKRKGSTLKSRPASFQV
ncbi:hypothetical protein ACHAWF_018711 [Thalassiosira exigua]